MCIYNEKPSSDLLDGKKLYALSLPKPKTKVKLDEGIALNLPAGGTPPAPPVISLAVWQKEQPFWGVAPSELQC